MLKIKLIFEPRDIWVGLFIEGWKEDVAAQWWTIYIILVPMFPIRIRWYHRWRILGPLE